MTIYVFGDSHAVSGFGRIAEAEVHWVGGRTMHRIGRDGAEQLLHGVSIEPGDVLIFVYGEIDIRWHIIRLAEQMRRRPSDMVRDLADRYSAALLRAQLQHPAVTVTLTSVVPPARWFVAGFNEFPVYGPLRERVRLTRELNDRLKFNAAQFGFAYLDYFHLYATRGGHLRFGLSDSNVHINSNHAEPIARALERQLGTKLTFLPAKSANVLLKLRRRSFASVLFRYQKNKWQSQLRRMRAKRRF